MTIYNELTDLIASAPTAQARELVDRASACVESQDYRDALALIDRIPPGYTSWHERLNATREKVEQCDEGADDPGTVSYLESIDYLP